MSVRTRFAPSPTGHVHIGNIRAAIFNWLFARHSGGAFLLRVEDTDRERSTQAAIDTLLGAMRWLGLEADEEPVYQSSRRDAHLAVAEDLLARGLAYRSDKGGTGRGEAVVFRMPGSDMAFRDEVKGELRKAAADMNDLVIVRSDGNPVFHLANVVDDIHMGITHVIRGDDHVENTYRHIALYQAIGAPVPKFAHLPMIVNEHGKPYSKRDGAAYVGDFQERGYLPGALFNYLALLGWSPGDDREVMALDEMTAAFSFDRVASSPARFDLQKLAWMNGVYMRALPRPELVATCGGILRERGLWNGDEAYLEKVIALLGDRIQFFGDVADQAGYFFTDDYAYDDKAVRKRLDKEGAREGLAALRDRFAGVAEFTPSALEEALRLQAEALGVGAGNLIHPIRVAVSGGMAGPSLFEMLELLGRDRVLARIDRTLSTVIPA